MWVEKQFEERMRPYIDDIYHQLFSQLKSIVRRDQNDNNASLNFMDSHLGIDTLLIFHDGSLLTLQEKTLKPFQASFNQFTFEYYNTTNKTGDWFKLASQLYFWGYASCQQNFYDGRIKSCDGKCESCNYLKGYYRYWIFDVCKLRIFLKKRYPVDAMIKLGWLHQNKPPAQANFWCIPFEIFDDDVFLYQNL